MFVVTLLLVALSKFFYQFQLSCSSEIKWQQISSVVLSQTPTINRLVTPKLSKSQKQSNCSTQDDEKSKKLKDSFISQSL
jgi:hypothetical protein